MSQRSQGPFSTLSWEGSGSVFTRSEAEGQNFNDPTSFETLLSSHLQRLQAFVLDEVDTLKLSNSPGPCRSSRDPTSQPFKESVGLFDLPQNLESFWQTPSLDEVASLRSGGQSPRLSPHRSPSLLSLKTSQDDDEDVQNLLDSGPRKVKSVDSEKGLEGRDEEEGKLDGAPESTKSIGVAESTKSVGVESVPESCTTVNTTRTTKLEQVLSLMYHNEVEGSTDRYSAKTLGFHVRFLNDSNFQSIVIDVVLTIFVFANVISMGVRTELWEGSIFWDIIEAVFISAFSFALLLRIYTQGLADTFILGPDRGWNWFEVLQLVVGWFEVLLSFQMVDTDAAFQDASFFALLRMVRMIRITRVLRICRLQIFSELLVMVVGTLGGMKTLAWAAALTAVPMYALAIMFRETLGERGGPTGLENFGSFQMAFYTVFRCTVSGECSDAAGRPILKLVAQEDGWGYVVVFCMMEFFMAFGLYNVVQGIFLENVLAGAKTNELALKRERLRNQAYFAEKMAELLTVVVRLVAGSEQKSGEVLSVADLLVAAADLSITPEVFEEIRRSPDVVTLLKELAVSDEDMMYLFETLDSDGDGHIDLHEFVEGVAKLRGGPRRSDVIANNFILQKVMSELQEQGTATAAMLAQHERLLRSLQRAIQGEEGPPSAKPTRRGRSQPRIFVQQPSSSSLNLGRMEQADSGLGRSGGSLAFSPAASLSSRGKQGDVRGQRRYSSPNIAPIQVLPPAPPDVAKPTPVSDPSASNSNGNLVPSI